jgi:hypothetical protein
LLHSHSPVLDGPLTRAHPKNPLRQGNPTGQSRPL